MRPGAALPIVAMQLGRRRPRSSRRPRHKNAEARPRSPSTLRARISCSLRRRKRDAIPHHTAVGLLQKQRGLAGRKARLNADVDNAEIVAQPHLVRSCKLLARPCRPFQFTNCRSSSPIRQPAGGVAYSGNCTALKAGPEGHGVARPCAIVAPVPWVSIPAQRPFDESST
jgi:hypothetical protein